VEKISPLHKKATTQVNRGITLAIFWRGWSNFKHMNAIAYELERSFICLVLFVCLFGFKNLVARSRDLSLPIICFFLNPNLQLFAVVMLE